MEAKSLHRDTDHGLREGDEPPSFVEVVKSGAENAAGVVGEFASKMSHDAHEGALRATEVMEHAAFQAKEAVSEGATTAKDTVEDFLGLDDIAEGDAVEGSPPRSFSLEQPETPIIVPPPRPPTPPKPRAPDAPETPPVLDLGGPAHPHVYPPSYQRKPSLKITPGTLGVTATGIVPFGDAGAKRPSWFDMRHWDKNGKCWCFMLSLGRFGLE